MKKLLAAACFLFLAGCNDSLQPTTSPHVSILSYGKYRSEKIGMEENSDMIAGTQNIISDELVHAEQTTLISKELGVEFGMVYQVTDPEGRAHTGLEEVIIFPGGGLTNPNTGRTAKMDSELYEVETGVPVYFVYSLDYDWEAQPGDWVFQVKHLDRVLAEKTFTLQ